MKVAYWTNGLGEEMSSQVHAEFARDGQEYIVVFDWREATRGHGLIVLERGAALVRTETPR